MFGELSNFSLIPLRIRDKGQVFILPSAEHLYQAAKFPGHFEIRQEIYLSQHPGLAKQISYRYPESVIEDWDTRRVKCMWDVLNLKFDQNKKSLIQVLRDTGDMPIVEFSKRDLFWGAGPVTDPKELEGKNILGRLWMQLRDERAYKGELD